jgi:demethylmenaquinone methyltransferase/2-methoxy-6-polyprenyl-1,4-benzoquinol methylase
MVLEMTFPRQGLPRRFFKFYFKFIIPLLGGLISGDWNAYRYLPSSIKDFFTPEEMSALFQSVGLTSVQAFPLTLGITYLHCGEKLGNRI